MRNVLYAVIIDDIRFSGCIFPRVVVPFACCACALNKFGVDDLKFAALCVTAEDVEARIVQLRFGHPSDDNACIGQFCSENGITKPTMDRHLP